MGVTFQNYGDISISIYQDGNNSTQDNYFLYNMKTQDKSDKSILFVGIQNSNKIILELYGNFSNVNFSIINNLFDLLTYYPDTLIQSSRLIDGSNTQNYESETYSPNVSLYDFWNYNYNSTIYNKFLSGNDIYMESSGVIGDFKTTIVDLRDGNDIFYHNHQLNSKYVYDDYYYGGNGIDVVVYNKSNKDFCITYSQNVFDYVTNNHNLNGFVISDTKKYLTPLTINFIEKIQFSDLTLDTTMFTKTAALSSSQIVNLVELYIASFNRAPDSVGLYYWGGRLSDGMSLEQIAKSFFVQPETVAAYPTNMPTSDFVTKVYNNVLSRGPDKGGLDYWVGELITGHVTKDSFLLAIINGAMAPTGSAVDRQTLANKESVGAYYALTQGLNNSTTWAKDVMSAVTDQMATVTAANAKTDGYAAIAANPATSDLVVKLLGVAI